MSEPLTDRQQQVLDFINAHHRQHGVSPSLREIQAHFGLASPFGIKRHVDALTEKGALRRLDGKARGLLPSSHPRRGALAEIPLYGTIPAGFGVETQVTEPDSYISVDTVSLGVRPTTKLFALRVRGDSMINASILDGDTVFLTPREPRQQDIVAALIDGESTLKRYLVQRGHAFLRAENPRYPDLLPAQELIIQGVMIGLLRTQTN
ncbi:transcriptional repressor LexA [Horticoccus sp. 23ND18S-11]|uniref:transcriptional repressor LexA n=1 Tax=Horticoccus sp. 23ND18S-11 TaxID=3391832 RepID=UPI0039C91804